MLQRIDDRPINYAEWCVFYAGNGHYFPTFEEAKNYMIKRKFMKGIKNNVHKM